MPSPHLTPATLLLVAGLCSSPLYSQALPSAPAIDPALAAQYFREAQQVCTHDAGELWGRSLCGPMMFVDDLTRSIAANQADKEGLLTEKEGVFVGKLPAQFSAANTAVVIAGVNWTMIEWPLPVTPAGRARLMAHELFHRIQAELGLPPSGPANAHLDSREDRIWLQLELRALRQALARTSAPASERYASVGDALVFRARRQSFFPNGAAEERALEMHEGLAEYTGMRLRGPRLPPPRNILQNSSTVFPIIPRSRARLPIAPDLHTASFSTCWAQIGGRVLLRKAISASSFLTQ